MGPRGVVHCSVATCLNNSSMPHNKLSFFTLPKDPERRKEWTRLIWRQDLNELSSISRDDKICQDHFSEDCFMHRTPPKILKPDALPCLCLPQTPIIRRKRILTHSISVQTTKTIPTELNITTISRKRKFKNEKTEEHPQLELDRLINKFVPFELDRLCKVRDMMIAKNGQRYYKNYKLFCFNLYNSSPQTYNMFQGFLQLPNVRNLYKEIPVTTEINKDLMKALQFKVLNMTDLERHCLVLVDNMSLTPQYSYDDEEEKVIGFQEINGVQSPSPAVKAVLLIVHGMFTKWVLPVGYALLSKCTNSNLADWIIDVLKALCIIGLDVHILNFTNATESESEIFQKSRVSVDEPFFFVNDRKIYHINDSTLLLKLLRDCLLQNDVYFNDRKAKYEHIIQFYKEDQEKAFRLAPKLTHDHVYPTSAAKNKASYAVEILSKSVARGLSAYIDLKVIEKDGMAVVDLINNINALCECLNWTKSCDKSQLLYSYGSRITFLKEMMTFMQDLKFVDSKTGHDVTTTCKSIICSFQITIHSMLCLLENMKAQGKLDLPMRTCNKGITNQLIMQLRSWCCNSEEPYTQEFEKAFKHLVVANIIEPLAGRDMPHYRRKFISQLHKVFISQPEVNTSKKHHDTNVELNMQNYIRKVMIPPSDYNQIDKTEKHKLVYVTGYLLKKCKEKHGYCKTFSCYLDPKKMYITDNDISRYKEYSERHNMSLICSPRDDFVQIVELMEEKFCKIFKQCLNIKIERALCNEINTLSFRLPCRCFPVAYLIKLFIRLRIAYTVKLNNRELSRNAKHFVTPLLLSI